MKTSQNGVNLIKNFEGCVLKAYKPVPTEKYFTIGYGHYGSDVNSNDKILQSKAEDLLKGDLKKFEDGVEKLVKVTINQNQFDALVSFSYNLGLGNLESSDLLKFINKEDFKNAAKEFPLWIHAGGKVLQGLVKRRKAEQELFVKPVPKSEPASKPVIPSYKGKRVEAKVEVNFYHKPSWEDKDVVGACSKGMGFDIVEKIKVGNSYQYKVKNSRGLIYYITANEQYVKVV